MNKSPLAMKALTRSIWVFHVSAGSCNNCDIEILDLSTPRHDVERFGIQLVGSVRHADALLITGAMNRKAVPRMKKVYGQAPKPCVVVAVGQCALSQHMFRDSYNCLEPLDAILPVDVYIPGCPPKPEAMIDGIVKLIGKIRSGK
jgi:Ni,Fe-hydrogenase III small subunit